ncbi:MAG TPA: hypothetical protein VK202_11225 [Bacteroidia bacterium]|nr:hypothetical protein [Bacteroidia bacterium]
MSKEEVKRDEKDNTEMDIDPFDWNKHRWWNHTYIFQYLDEQSGRYIPYFNIHDFDDKKLEEARNSSDYKEVVLYRTPDHPSNDFFIHYHNWQLGLLMNFFKDVFEERSFIMGHIPMNKYYRVILTKELHEKILNHLNDSNLLLIRDLIMEVIAIAQHKFVEDISFWENPQMQKLVKSANKETKKAIELIDKIEDKEWMRNPGASKPAELLRINFVFQDKTIKIEHPWLAKEFIETFKDHYNGLAYKDWRIDLERYPQRFEVNVKKGQFKYRLAISLYNLLTKGDFFKLEEGVRYPNDLMLCISKIIEFCLIPVGSFEETNEVKIKHIHNWLTRNDLQEAVTHVSIPADKEKLLKYFDETFINMTGDQKQADALGIAAYIGKRFNVEHLLPDLAHIAQVLKEGSLHWGHQLLSDGRPYPPNFSDFDALRKLIITVKSKQKITGIKFTVEGDAKEYEMTDRLPLYLLENSFGEYMKDHQVEFDTDAVKTNISITPMGLSSRQEKQFNRPEERISVRFVKAFYNYLLAEAPPGERDFMPSERYYAIIANMLQMTWFFYHKQHPEWFLTEKVKRWHMLS